jgi:hypothetical protein
MMYCNVCLRGIEKRNPMKSSNFLGVPKMLTLKQGADGLVKMSPATDHLFRRPTADAYRNRKAAMR